MHACMHARLYVISRPLAYQVGSMILGPWAKSGCFYEFGVLSADVLKHVESLLQGP